MSDIVPNQQNLIIYNTLDGKVSVTMMARDGNVWMNQKQMAELFATSVPNVNIHISNILKENELDRNSVIKDYLITAADVLAVYEEFDQRRKQADAQLADQMDDEELKQLEQQIENRK